MHLWCRLIAQAVLTLNLLRTSNIYPKLSAEAQLNSNFDYNITPLAPAGTAVVAHENPIQRGPWSVHEARVWYLGPAPNQVYITKAGQTRIVDTVEFYPAKCKMSTLSTRSIAVKAAVELTEAILNMTDLTKIQFNDNELRDIQKLFTII